MHVSKQIQDIINKMMPHALKPVRSNAQRAWQNFVKSHAKVGEIHQRARGGKLQARIPIYRRIYSNRGHIPRGITTPKSHKNTGKQYPEYVKWKERFDAKHAKHTK